MTPDRPQPLPSDHRRKWDRSQYTPKTSSDHPEEDKKSKNAKRMQAIQRELLKARDYKVDLESKVGSSFLISQQSESAGGYYCNVCDCVVKDSINFLDHINGKNHQRNMGMSMKVRRSTVEDVKKRFEAHKRKASEPVKEYKLNDRIREIEDKERQMKDERREKKKRARFMNGSPLNMDIIPEDPECGLEEIMGFKGFGSSKKSR